MNSRNRVTAIVTLAAAVAAGCSAASDASTSGFDESGGASADGGTAPSPGTGSGTGNTGGNGGTPLPPETKVEQTYRSPVATGHVVWIANPTSGRVAYIDAATLEARTVEAGNGPTYLAAVPDAIDDVAIVQNVLSHDATLLRDHLGALSSRTFPITADANAWAIEPGGRFAIAWTDASLVAKADPTQGFQDVAVLDLSGTRPATNLAVGYRPVKLAFSADGSRAFAVTQDGISVVDLVGGAAPTVTKNYAISDSPTDDPGTRDVSITPGGELALVRRDGQAAITVVALATGTRTTVTLPSPPTDLTLSPAGDFALAVLRDAGTIAVLPLPAIATSPTAFTLVPITGQVVGRAIVTKKGDRALLFTTVSDASVLTVLTLTTTPPTFRVLKLHAPVLAVFPTDDGANAVVLHRMTPVAGSTVKGAFSVVPVDGDLPAKIVGTTAPPTGVALAPTSDRALVTTRDDASRTYGVYLAKMPSLEVIPFPLASPPMAVGIAAVSGRGFVAQEHPEGRITFLDLAAGQARTITGFELGARVVDGSKP